MENYNETVEEMNENNEFITEKEEKEKVEEKEEPVKKTKPKYKMVVKTEKPKEVLTELERMTKRHDDQKKINEEREARNRAGRLNATSKELEKRKFRDRAFEFGELFTKCPACSKLVNIQGDVFYSSQSVSTRLPGRTMFLGSSLCECGMDVGYMTTVVDSRGFGYIKNKSVKYGRSLGIRTREQLDSNKVNNWATKCLKTLLPDQASRIRHVRFK